MAGETRRKFDRDFREGAVRLVRETDKPIAQVARDPGDHGGPWEQERRAGHSLPQPGKRTQEGQPLPGRSPKPKSPHFQGNPASR
jgi:transposase-like protein